VVAGNQKDWTIETGQEIANLTDQFPADTMVFEGITSDEHEFGTQLSGQMLNATDGLKSGASDLLGGLTYVGSFHANLPIGRVYESHANPLGACSRTDLMDLLLAPFQASYIALFHHIHV
jgi:hypothetical protein